MAERTLIIVIPWRKILGIVLVGIPVVIFSVGAISLIGGAIGTLPIVVTFVIWIVPAIIVPLGWKVSLFIFTVGAIFGTMTFSGYRLFEK